MWNKFIHDFLLIWVTIEPFSSLALFTVLTCKLSNNQKRKIAFKAVCYSILILILSILVGQFLLNIMGIKLISFQIAGGVILFLFGLQMIFGQAASFTIERPEHGHDIAVFPLAVPSIVGPESIIAIILLTDNYIYPITSQLITTVAMLLVLGITFLMMLLAERIIKIIGKNGAAIIEKIMGMVLTALAVEMIMSALGIERWQQSI